jgi:threonine/homoserine/homoserine lactone efflux protein/ketosteroid isomerase-like protein
MPAYSARIPFDAQGDDDMAHPAPDLWLFFLLVFGVIVLPGMDMAYVASSALVGGWRAGLRAVGGIMTGGLVHVTVAMTGLAALLTAWPAAFDAMLAIGALYMLWIGWQIVGSARSPDTSGPETVTVGAGDAVFRRAVTTCLLNPKAYAFSLAVFPAFVRTPARPVLLQGLALAAIVVGTQALVYGAVAAAAVRTARSSVVGAAGARWLPRIVGPLLMAGAIATLLLGWKPAQAQPASAPSAAAATVPAATTAPGAHDPAHDFDFLIGDWRVDNRKRLHVLQGDEHWERFSAELHVRPLGGGVGDHDEFVAPAWRPGFTAVTLRLYSAQAHRWSLYSLSSRGDGLDPATGQLTAPVTGNFHGDEGVFEGDDRWADKPIRVRYTWTRIDTNHAQWAQAFSPDAGRHWETNWTMSMTRIDPVAEVLAVEQALCDAYLHGDVAGLQRGLTDDFTLSNGRGETSTKAEDIETARTGAIRYTRFENREMQVRLYGPDSAVVTGITAVAGRTKDGYAFDIEVRFTDTLVRDQGQWRLAASQASGALAKP